MKSHSDDKTTGADPRARCAGHEAKIARLTAERDAAQSAAGAWARKCAAADEMLDTALAGAVKVKPLVWENFDAWTYWAKCAFGTYRAQERNGVWKATLQRGDNTELTYEYTTDGLTPGDFEAAQVAAQSDYEARILAAIQPDPEARQAALAKAAIVALHDIDDLVANSDGVSGLHLNGNMAPWSEIMDGGAYGAWLQSVERLREAIRALTPPADLAAKIGGE